MLARLPFVLLLSLAAPATAQTPTPVPAPVPARTSLAVQMLAGSWALRVDGAIVFRFDLVSDGSGWSGSWVRPARSSPMARASPRYPVQRPSRRPRAAVSRATGSS
jgi:hypothetical protein